MKVISPASLMAHTPSAETARDDLESFLLLLDLAVEVRIGQGDRAHGGQRPEQRDVGVVEGFGPVPAGHRQPERLAGDLHRCGETLPGGLLGRQRDLR